MKIYTDDNLIIHCSKCSSDEFKPAGNGKFKCRNCGEPETGKTKREGEPK